MQSYQVVKQQDSFAVVDPSHRTIITCQNELNAQHYAQLLNSAYESGYKAGYKAAKHIAD
ncbi:MAG: hypothetical protein AMJ53_13810 [Gammaproteobacteria bacterium SG8_11]|nr:MAG: hypothetical protein AMJ53_13810 [Gammaproteobacteria bacterium SG8_11]